MEMQKTSMNYPVQKDKQCVLLAQGTAGRAHAATFRKRRLGGLRGLGLDTVPPSNWRAKGMIAIWLKG